MIKDCVNGTLSPHCSVVAQVLCGGLCILNRNSCFAWDDLWPVQMCVCFSASMLHVLYGDLSGWWIQKHCHTSPLTITCEWVMWMGHLQTLVQRVLAPMIFSLLCNSWLTMSLSLTPLAISWWLFSEVFEKKKNKTAFSSFHSGVGGGQVEAWFYGMIYEQHVAFIWIRNRLLMLCYIYLQYMVFIQNNLQAMDKNEQWSPSFEFHMRHFFFLPIYHRNLLQLSFIILQFFWN